MKIPQTNYRFRLRLLTEDITSAFAVAESLQDAATGRLAKLGTGASASVIDVHGVAIQKAFEGFNSSYAASFRTCNVTKAISVADSTLLNSAFFFKGAFTPTMVGDVGEKVDEVTDSVTLMHMISFGFCLFENR
jgi:hypothetical protein